MRRLLTAIAAMTMLVACASGDGDAEGPTYDVFRDGDQWYWTGGGVELSPFTIVEGNQLP